MDCLAIDAAGTHLNSSMVAKKNGYHFPCR